MKIVFMGTPDFAVPSLKVITESSHSVVGVVTGVDKEQGRGQKISYTAVKQYAIENSLRILQPEKLKDPQFITELESLKPDLIVVVAFKILPPEVFNIPLHGSFNLHGSILPKYRGAAPIQWALINGEQTTGVTTFKLEQKVDTGNIYLQRELDIEDDDDMGSLHDKMSFLGAECVIDTINLIDSGNYTLQKQDDSLSTPAPKITREMGKIDWNQPAKKIHNLVRAFSPAPGAYFFHDGKQIKIYKTSVYDASNEPGSINTTGSELVIACGERSLKIHELQQEGRKRLSTESFLRGYSFD